MTVIVTNVDWESSSLFTEVLHFGLISFLGESIIFLGLFDLGVCFVHNLLRLGFEFHYGSDQVAKSCHLEGLNRSQRVVFFCFQNFDRLAGMFRISQVDTI